MKVCSKCGHEKPRSEFSPNKRNRDGLRGWCKKCASTYQRRYYAEHPDFAARQNARQRDRLKDHDRHLWRKYRFTEADKERMYVNQDGSCALCRLSTAYARIEIDHDHKTGSVRGLLCRRCNHLVGMVDTSKELMYDVFQYIGL